MSARHRYNPPRFIIARFASTCPQTGKRIERGDECAYYPGPRVAYHVDSKAASEIRAMDFAATWGMADANY